MGIYELIAGVFSIVVSDLVLAGDNALVIAMAVRSLPQRQRRRALIFGAGGAVALRVGLTALAAQLLTTRYVQLAGGLLILWIAVRLLLEVGEPPDAAPAPGRVFQAIWYIVAADVTMSTDNILAIAGLSKGNISLIVFGLCLSIPFVIFGASLLAKVMGRYPVLIYLGAAILGRVAGEMILTDTGVSFYLQPSNSLLYGVEAALAVGVVVTGWTINRLRKGKGVQENGRT